MSREFNKHLFITSVDFFVQWVCSVLVVSPLSYTHGNIWLSIDIRYHVSISRIYTSVAQLAVVVVVVCDTVNK